MGERNAKPGCCGFFSDQRNKKTDLVVRPWGWIAQRVRFPTHVDPTKAFRGGWFLRQIRAILLIPHRRIRGSDAFSLAEDALNCRVLRDEGLTFADTGLESHQDRTIARRVFACVAKDYDSGDLAGIAGENKDRPLFRSTVRKTKRLTGNPMTSKSICELVKRRLKDAKLPNRLSPHSFRVSAVTDLLTQGVPLEDVQYLAGHSSSRTTRLYDRRQKKVTRNIMERIAI